MNQRRTVVLALVWGALLASADAAIAADEAANNTAGEQQSDTIKLDPLDEIIINGHRGSLRQLRQEAEKAEDAVYEAFNQVNTVPEYRTRCDVDTRSSGGMSRVHVCRPQFAETAMEDEAQSIVRFGFVARPASMVIGPKMIDYRNHIRDLARKNPNLRRALGHYYALSVRYENEFKEKLKGKWFVWD